MDIEPIINIEKLSARMGDRPVLVEVDISAARGEIVALFGHNGAGKSTLLRCVMGILPHDSGSIRLAFADWRRDPRALFRAGVAYLPQNDKVFPSMTVEENLLLSAEALKMGHQTFARRCEELAKDFPILVTARKMQTGRLSGGERQQVALARTLLSQPKLMLLDEPSIGLAPQVRERVFSAIRTAADRWGAAVILVEHRIREALQIADHAYTLRRGAIVSGGAASDLLGRPEQLRSVIT
jgi:branched-chain amino acid transport system ATP-binding protein